MTAPFLKQNSNLNHIGPKRVW